MTKKVIRLKTLPFILADYLAIENETDLEAWKKKYKKELEETGIPNGGEGHKAHGGHTDKKGNLKSRKSKKVIIYAVLPSLPSYRIGRKKACPPIKMADKFDWKGSQNVD